MIAYSLKTNFKLTKKLCILWTSKKWSGSIKQVSKKLQNSKLFWSEQYEVDCKVFVRETAQVLRRMFLSVNSLQIFYSTSACVALKN